jgi:anaerobic selenocysteine-containing dehydrogenase
MGFEDDCLSDSDDVLIDAALSSESPFLKNINLDRLDREGSVRLNLGEPGQPFRPFAKGGFGTRSGKFEFGAESLEFHAPAESRNGDRELRAKYPIELISAKNDDSMNSTLGNRDGVDRQTAVCEMSAEDAESRDIQSGDLVRLFNDRGECYLTARIGGSVRPGVVRTRSTRWNKRSLKGLGINRLTSDRLADMGSGPTFYSCLVQIEACPDVN